MSVLVTIVDLICNAIPSWNILIAEAKDTIGKFNECNTKEMEKAQEVVDDRDDISIDLYNEIVRICEGDEKSVEILTAKAIATEKWIKYVIYYLTDPSAIKIGCDLESAELANTIANFLVPEAGPIYENAPVKNIDKFDATKIRTDRVKFILLKNDLATRFTTEMIEKAKAKFYKKPEEIIKSIEPSVETQQLNERRGRYDEMGLYHPNFVQVDKDVAKKIIEDKPLMPDQINQTRFNMFEQKLKRFIGNRNHHYTTDSNNNVYLNIVNGDCLVTSYMLDDGSIMGGRTVSILGTYIDQTNQPNYVFVNIDRHPDIVSRILSGSFYMLTPQEASIIFANLFYDQRIYQMIDFSNTPFINDNNLRLIERPLTAICNYNTENARLRFVSYTDPYNFTLVSDDKCKSYIPGSTTTNIVNGMIYGVQGDRGIAKSFGGEGIRFSY